MNVFLWTSKILIDFHVTAISITSSFRSLVNSFNFIISNFVILNFIIFNFSIFDFIISNIILTITLFFQLNSVIQEPAPSYDYDELDLKFVVNSLNINLTNSNTLPERFSELFERIFDAFDEACPLTNAKLTLPEAKFAVQNDSSLNKLQFVLHSWCDCRNLVFFFRFFECKQF